MTAKTTLPDPLDIIPEPDEVRRRLGATYREARMLRSLLRLSERRRDHRRMSEAAVRTDAEREAARDA